MFDFEFLSHSFQRLSFQTLFQCLCWIQNTNLQCLASSITPLSCKLDFLQALFMGAAQIFRIVGGNEQSWADVTLAHLAGTGAFLPNLFPPHTPLHSPHLSPFDLSNDPNESDSVFFEAQSPNLYLLCNKIQ